MVPKLVRALSTYKGLQICASHTRHAQLHAPSRLRVHTRLIRFAFLFPLEILRCFELTFFFFWQTVLIIINLRHIYLLHTHHTTSFLSKLNRGNGRTLFIFSLSLFINYFCFVFVTLNSRARVHHQNEAVLTCHITTIPA